MQTVERPAVFRHFEFQPRVGLLSSLLAGSALSLILTLPAVVAEAAPSGEIQVAGAAPAPPTETVIIQGQRREDFQVDVPFPFIASRVGIYVG